MSSLRHTAKTRRRTAPAGHVFTLEPLRRGSACLGPDTLTDQELKALRATEGGVDVVSPVLARTLRDLHTRRPELVTLTNAPADKTGLKPYFGALLTAAGRVALAKGGA